MEYLWGKTPSSLISMVSPQSHRTKIDIKEIQTIRLEFVSDSYAFEDMVGVILILILRNGDQMHMANPSYHPSQSPQCNNLKHSQINDFLWLADIY
jgi:hypothetical protein